MGVLYILCIMSAGHTYAHVLHMCSQMYVHERCLLAILLVVCDSFVHFFCLEAVYCVSEYLGMVLGMLSFLHCLFLNFHYLGFGQ